MNGKTEEKETSKAASIFNVSHNNTFLRCFNRNSNILFSSQLKSISSQSLHKTAVRLSLGKERREEKKKKIEKGKKLLLSS